VPLETMPAAAAPPALSTPSSSDTLPLSKKSLLPFFLGLNPIYLKFSLADSTTSFAELLREQQFNLPEVGAAGTRDQEFALLSNQVELLKEVIAESEKQDEISKSQIAVCFHPHLFVSNCDCEIPCLCLTTAAQGPDPASGGECQEGNSQS